MILIKHFYQWNKKEIWKIYLVILFPFMIDRIINHDTELKKIILGLSIFYWIRYMQKMRLMAFKQFDGFSFKFLQSLPMNRKDMLISLSFIDFIIFTPLIIMVAHWAALSFDVISVLKFSLSAFLGIMTFCLLNQLDTIKRPRVEYFRKILDKHATSTVYKTFGIFTLACSLFLYAVLRWDLLDQYKDIILKYFIIPLEFVIDYSFLFLNSWLLPFAILAWSFFMLEKTLKVWEEETLSYPKSLPKEDKYTIRIIATSFLLLFVHLYLTPPFKYIDSDLLTAVYDNDYQKVQQLLKNGNNINQKNKYGYTPLIVAAAEGNLKMYKFLEAQRAQFAEVAQGNTGHVEYNILDLALRSKNENLVIYILSQSDTTNIQKDYPLHAVASKCMTRALDYLMEKGMDVNIQDKLGQTPLHYAASANCFGPVVSLLEKGANPTLKDKKGKMAKDLIPSNKELAYLLEKRARMPASQI